MSFLRLDLRKMYIEVPGDRNDEEEKEEDEEEKNEEGEKEKDSVLAAEEPKAVTKSVKDAETSMQD